MAVDCRLAPDYRLSPNYRLYLVTDRYLVGAKDFFESIRKALEGGVTLLQLREKSVSSKEFYTTGLEIKRLAAEFGVPLLVNDRVDLALALDADGVHIGQEDLPIEKVRQIIGKDKILGYSVSNVEEAIYGERMGADYLGAGPVYPTGSKADAGKAIGIDELKAIKQNVSIPVVAIGGVNSGNITQVKTAGVDGIAVISAILSQDDPYLAAKELNDLWQI